MFTEIVLPALVFVLIPSLAFLVVLIYEKRRLKRNIKRYY